MSRRRTGFFFLSRLKSSGGAFDIDVKSIVRKDHHPSPFNFNLFVIKYLFYHPLLSDLTSSTADTMAGRLASNWFMKCKHKINRKKAKRFEIVFHTSRTTFSRRSILARELTCATHLKWEVNNNWKLLQIKAAFNHLNSWYLWVDFESSPMIVAMQKMLLTCATRDEWPKKHV